MISTNTLNRMYKTSYHQLYHYTRFQKVCPVFKTLFHHYIYMYVDPGSGEIDLNSDTHGHTI